MRWGKSFVFTRSSPLPLSSPAGERGFINEKDLPATSLNYVPLPINCFLP
jgi:hypothetical protein